jgi:hypothetical protein
MKNAPPDRQEHAMPVEPNLHDLFRSATDGPTGKVDAAEVIRRSRRRRLPAQLGVGSVATLAVAGVSVLGVNGLYGGLGPRESTALSASAPAKSGAIGAFDSSGTATTGGAATVPAPPGSIGGTTAAQLNVCAQPVASIPPSATGLLLTARFPDAAVGSTNVDGTVTLTNHGTTRVSGSTAATPMITLSRNGIVYWHSNGAMSQVAVAVDLEPGASMTYPASFTPVICGAEDEAGSGFRDNLPPAPAGRYEVSAAIDFMSGGPAELVAGPQQSVWLR